MGITYYISLGKNFEVSDNFMNTVNYVIYFSTVPNCFGHWIDMNA